MVAEFFQHTISNLLSPVVMLFAAGFVLTLRWTQLRLPASLGRALAGYLMIAIGWKGGAALARSGLSAQIGLAMIAALGLGIATAWLSFLVLKKVGRLDTSNAGALAAHYGSVSVVTFATAAAALEQSGVHYDGFMVGLLAVMEIPAILLALFLVRLDGYASPVTSGSRWRTIAGEVLFNPGIFVLLGSMGVACAVGPGTERFARAAFIDPFPFALGLFLFEMGMKAGERVTDFKRIGRFLSLFAIGMPVVNGLLGALVGALVGFGQGNATLLAVLAASASYIAAPAAVRVAIPQANPAFYVTASLALTFPFNILVGIPLYRYAAQTLTSLLQ